jgi:hypothetical protein
VVAAHQLPPSATVAASKMSVAVSSLQFTCVAAECRRASQCAVHGF